jgi:fibronectin-binding autotransporter adhesin
VVEALLRREGMGVSENALLARARGYLRRGAVLAALALLMMLLNASTAWAETFTVTNLNVTGAGSLSEAIDRANSTLGADEVMFAPGVSGTIELNGTVLPAVTDPAGLTIDGGANGITVSGPSPLIFEVFGALSLNSLTVTGGFLSGIRNSSPHATLEVVDSTISGNANFDDPALGGGISNRAGGTVTIVDSTITGNTARGDFGGGAGGGIYNSGTLTIIGSTVSNNIAYGETGGIDTAGTTTITNSTVSGNFAFAGANGIDNSGKLTMTSSTDADDIIHRRVFDSSKATLRNTIVASAGDSCRGDPITDGGYNIDNGSTCGFSPETGSLPNTNPLLDPAGLADNGGPTKTIALLPESPAVDLVGQDACPPPQIDQRGVERPQGEACDAGAFELVQGPQTKADCKKGGWEEFGFKNQGQCIASLQKEQLQTSQ